MPWKFINKAATETEPENVELRIEGEILDDDDVWIAEWLGIKATSPNAFRNELAAHAGKPITAWIDSPGGNVFAATGIYAAIQEHKAKKTAKVLKSMSAASVIQMAFDDILMVPTGLVMIHDPVTEGYGYAKDFRKIADILDEVKEAIMNAYQLKTGRSRSKLSAMMDAETYMSARTAIKEGFATGMLYGDAQTEPIEMSFERRGFTNSMSDAMKRMVALCKEQSPPGKPPDIEQLKAKLALECEII